MMAFAEGALAGLTLVAVAWTLTAGWARWRRLRRG